ncbi:MAG: hypothetical protein QM589_11425 [Thermomicrobiales bacterium]
MSRPMLCTALLIATVSALALLMVAVVTGATDVLANRTPDTPVVSTHESSGIEMPGGQINRGAPAVPNYSLDGTGAVSPDPYHPTPAASCVVPYQTTAGGKTVLKYGTIEGCSTESSPHPSTGAGARA